jgi:D-alanyl-D-alanine carboxypeptidase
MDRFDAMQIRLLPVLIILAAPLQAGCAGPERIATRVTTVRQVSDSRFDSFLKEMEQDEHFTGVALVMRQGEIIHAKAYGAATDNRANTVDTQFHVGSITKQFTAAAIMQLLEQAVVKLDGSINTYLPAQYRSPKWDGVTLHHLLSHTSGITDYAVTRDYYDVVKGFCSGETVNAMVREAMSKDLEFVPGSKYAYSNLGYTLLGLVIEHQTHIPYDQYIEENVLAPMGMTSSKIHVVGNIPATDEAEGLRWSEERGRHVPDDIVSLPSTAPDGGLITTLGDFATWAQIFTGGKQPILSQHSINLMSTPVIHIGAGGPLDSMGYGLYVGDRLIGHGGRVVGFSSQFIFDRETQSLIVVLTNDISNNPQRIAFGLLTIVLTTHP